MRNVSLCSAAHLPKTTVDPHQDVAFATSVFVVRTGNNQFMVRR